MSQIKATGKLGLSVITACFISYNVSEYKTTYSTSQDVPACQNSFLFDIRCLVSGVSFPVTDACHISRERSSHGKN